jgi:hypothetical protein
VPEHGRRGLGAALVDTVCAWGRENGFRTITVTFITCSWNAPFTPVCITILAPDECRNAAKTCARSCLWAS